MAESDIEARLPNIRLTAAHIESLITPGRPVEYSDTLVKKLHQLMTEGDDSCSPGQLRADELEVRYSEPGKEDILFPTAPPSELPVKLKDLGVALNTLELNERLAEGLWLLQYLHPFRDGNGRCVRALVSLVLREGGYLSSQDAVVDLLYRYFEVLKQKRSFGVVFKRSVEAESAAPLREYFDPILAALKDNGGRVPDTPPGWTPPP